MWNFPIKIITDLRSKSSHSKFSKFRFSFPFSFMQFSWCPNSTYQPRSTQIQLLPTKGIPISWFRLMTYSLHLLITIIIHKSINNDMNGNKIRNSISKLSQKQVQFRYLQTRIVAEICGNELHEPVHHARQTYQSESPSGSPIAGSHHCEDWQGSTASYCGNLVPSLYYSSSRTSSTSSPITVTQFQSL